MSDEKPREWKIMVKRMPGCDDEFVDTFGILNNLEYLKAALERITGEVTLRFVNEGEKLVIIADEKTGQIEKVKIGDRLTYVREGDRLVVEGK